MFMDNVTISLFLLLAVVLSGMIGRMSPLPIPLPLVQIAFGALIAVSTETAVDLDPSIFFLLFLPPLLFLDGWRISKEGLFHDKGTILELALGLVVFTVVGLGFFIHWMIPSMPLAVCFALAAILSPTDPIAVSAIAARTPIPKRLMHILEGESLLNDASGLVCMRFAVAAATTGVFSVGEAFASFLWVAIGGIFIGIALTWAVTTAKDYVSTKLGEETGSQILISILIPFGAYLIAEHVHTSGILAAVAAGMTMSYAEQRGRTLAATRVRRAAVWDMAQFALNGVIFVLLGEQLPSIVSGAARLVSETGHVDPIWMVFYVLAITLALGILRLAWVWVSLRFTLFRAAKKGRIVQTPSWRLIVATSLAGVRGAITLAGILTLPLAMNDGAPFPARDLAIFLAAGVIIVSLIAATVGLPFLLKNLELPPEPSHQRQEDRARVIAGEAAIKAIEERQHRMGSGREDVDLYSDTGAKLMEIYRQRIEGLSNAGDDGDHFRHVQDIERDLRLSAIRAERDAFQRLGRIREIPEDMTRKLVREIDLIEGRLKSS